MLSSEEQALQDEMRQLIADITRMPCVQPADGWTEECCDTCRFLVQGDCDIWLRRDDILERTNPYPF